MKALQLRRDVGEILNNFKRGEISYGPAIDDLENIFWDTTGKYDGDD